VYLCGRAGFTVVVTLFTVVKCIVGGEPTEAYGAGLSLGLRLALRRLICIGKNSSMDEKSSLGV